MLPMHVGRSPRTTSDRAASASRSAGLGRSFSTMLLDAMAIGMQSPPGYPPPRLRRSRPGRHRWSLGELPPPLGACWAGCDLGLLLSLATISPSGWPTGAHLPCSRCPDEEERGRPVMLPHSFSMTDGPKGATGPA
jgi:hypothetical protein